MIDPVLDFDPLAADTGTASIEKVVAFARRTVKETVMMLNEGKFDRVVRVVLGLALLAMVFVGPQTWLGWLGLVPLVTGLVGFCPLYRLIGIRTTKTA